MLIGWRRRRRPALYNDGRRDALILLGLADLAVGMLPLNK
jgi:hypothetical protein